MADETFDSILFQSEFNASDFVKGVDAMIDGVKKLEAQEKTLTETIAKAEQQLKDQDAAVKKLQASIDALDKSSRTFKDDEAKLAQQLAAVKKEQDALNTSLAQQKNQQASLQQSLNQTKSSYDKVKEAVQQVQAASGKPVSMQFDQQQIISAISDIRSYFEGFAQGINLDNIGDEIKAQVITAKDDIAALNVILDAAKEKLQTLDPDSQEFKELSEVVTTTNQVLEAYVTLTEESGVEQEKAGKKTVSLRTRIKELRDEITKLEDAGLENTETFQKLQIEAAQLTDQYGDMQQRIRILSSDTKLLDFGLSALQAAGAGYQVVAGGLTLFGVKSEDAEKAQAKLLAIMNFVQGAQTLQNLLLKEGIIRTVGYDIATKGAAAAKRLFALATNQATGSINGFKAALISSGIGAIIVLLGFAIAKLIEYANSSDDAADSVERFNKQLEANQKFLDGQIESIDRNGQLRIERLKQQGLSEAQINDELQKQFLEKKEAFDRAIISAENTQIKNFNKLSKEEQIKGLSDRLTAINKLYKDREKLEFDNDLRLLKNETSSAEERRKKAIDIAKKKSDDLLSAEKNYQDKLLQLQRKLRDLENQQQRQTGDQITKQVTQRLNDEIENINREVASGKLLQSQANKLIPLLRKINEVELSVELKEYNKRRKEATRALYSELEKVRMEIAEGRIENIRNELEREAAMIDQEFQKAVADLEEKKQALLKQIRDDVAAGLLTEEQAFNAINDVKSLIDRLYEELVQRAEIKRQELSSKLFQQALDNVSELFAGSFTKLNEETAVLITELSKKFTVGTISYEEFQKELTRINAEQQQKRLKLEEAELTSLLEGVRRRLTQSSGAEKQALEAQERDLRDRIAANRTAQANGEVEATNNNSANTKKRIDNITQQINAYAQLAQSIANAWQMANDAEQRSLERSQRIQERRVDAARRVAERGNAEYLQMEEEKQQELIQKQEAAARRQIAINAALQASQVLVAITGAISKIATPGIGTAEVIASIGVIIGALASGFAIVQSLQSNQPSFAEGEPYVRRDMRKNNPLIKRNGEPAGTDTIPAWLDEGEAVTDKHTNRKYNKAIRAIHNHAIPADVMNQFIDNYRSPNLPALNYDKLGTVANFHVTYDTRLAGILEKNNQKMDEVNNNLHRMNKTLGSIGVNFNWDKKGVELSLLGIVKQTEIDKKL